MKGTIKRFIIAAMAVTALCGNVLTVSAAESTDVFDPDYYAGTYADVAAVYGNDANALYQHYITCGITEGRMGSATFDVRKYRAAYPDLEAAFGDNWGAYLDHYVNAGAAEGRTAGLVNGAQTAPAQTTPTQTTPVQTTASGLPLTVAPVHITQEQITSDTPMPGVAQFAGNPIVLRRVGYREDDYSSMTNGGIVYNSHFILECDRRGSQIRGVTWDTDNGALRDCTLYFCDANGNVIQVEKYGSDGMLEYITVTTKVHDGHSRDDSVTYYMSGSGYRSDVTCVEITHMYGPWIEGRGGNPSFYIPDSYLYSTYSQQRREYDTAGNLINSSENSVYETYDFKGMGIGYFR